MQRALASGEAGLTAMQAALDTVANNLANVKTTAYKSQTVDFADLVYQAGVDSGYPRATAGQDVRLGVGSRVAAIGRDLSEGNLEQTKRPLDLAIDGPGYLAVAGPGRQTLYTRDGRLSLDARGQLVTEGGLPLVPAVTIPTGWRAVKIDGAGRVTVTTADGQTKQAGVIHLYTFADPQGLAPVGGNLYQATGAGGRAVKATGRIVQGSLEQSNVSLIAQMIDLLTVDRVYGFNGQAVQTADAMWSMANGLYQV